MFQQQSKACRLGRNRGPVIFTRLSQHSPPRLGRGVSRVAQLLVCSIVSHCLAAVLVSQPCYSPLARLVQQANVLDHAVGATAAPAGLCCW